MRRSVFSASKLDDCLGSWERQNGNYYDNLGADGNLARRVGDCFKGVKLEMFLVFFLGLMDLKPIMADVLRTGARFYRLVSVCAFSGY